MEWYSVLIIFGSLFAVVWNTVGAYNILLFGVKARRLGTNALSQLGLGSSVSKSYVGWKVYCVRPTEALVEVRTHSSQHWETGRCYEVIHTSKGDEYREWPLAPESSERVPLPFFAASVNLTGGGTVDIYKDVSKFAFKSNTLDEQFWNWFLVEIVGVSLTDVDDIKVLSTETFAITSLDTKNAIEL